ncbi:MAG: protease modulator HflC [Deferribacteres bacterium]|nr:protease modulator HflC [candidate division KSB1 bacterium]MCB9509226.1 protease modulator HflC [Deferribacteres bacterium]
MMKITQIGSIVVIFLVLLLASSSFYTVDETEQAIILQFGEPIGQATTEAGIHFKLPFIQDVVRFEKRIIEWDGDPNQISTEDKRYIWVNTFGRWKITDPLKFYQTVNNESNAQSRLDDIIDGVTRDIITNNKLIEVVRNTNRTMMAIGEDQEDTVPITSVDPIQHGRTEIRRLILERAGETVPQYGIDLIDVQIKHIDYIEEVRKKVYDRMIAERTRIAEKYRSEGEGERAKINGDRQKRLQEIESEAYRKAQELKGAADAEATRIYAEAFGRDPEFYSFMQTLDSYRTTMIKNSTLILKTDADYLKYLKKLNSR